LPNLKRGGGGISVKKGRQHGVPLAAGILSLEAEEDVSDGPLQTYKRTPVSGKEGAANNVATIEHREGGTFKNSAVITAAMMKARVGQKP
jgi:hypothetical protein